MRLVDPDHHHVISVNWPQQGGIDRRAYAVYNFCPTSGERPRRWFCQPLVLAFAMVNTTFTLVEISCVPGEMGAALGVAASSLVL